MTLAEVGTVARVVGQRVVAREADGSGRIYGWIRARRRSGKPAAVVV